MPDVKAAERVPVVPCSIELRLFVDADPYHLSPCGACHKESRAARTACDVQDARMGSQIQPFREVAIFICRQAAELTAILAVGLKADLLQNSA